MLIATHSGRFHADDVWAVTVLDVVFPGCELVRTRDMELISRADFAVDVGGVWDAKEGRFDHHQKGFSGARQSGVIYASAGLVWKEHGPRCVEIIAQDYAGLPLSRADAQHIAYGIDADLVQYLDMSDTGAAKNAPGGYGLSAVISGFNPSWIEEQRESGSDRVEALKLSKFRRAMEFMRDVLGNAVKYRLGAMLAAEEVRRSDALEEGRILVLKNGAMPWASVVRNEMPKVRFVIGHDLAAQRYTIHTVPAGADTFESRKDLPAAWAGLRAEELALATGVSDAVFCHNNLFIAAAESFSGALALARLALIED